MPTLNGARFVKNQIDSILQQEMVYLDLFVRDDGSTDGTCDILKEYSNEINVILDNTKLLGTTGSLLTILNKIENINDYDFLALADQDDIWTSAHLITSIDSLERYPHEPAISFPEYECIDELGDYIKKLDQPKKLHWLNSIFENPLIGCGLVLNSKGIQLLQNSKIDESYYLDAQLYFLFSAFGVVVPTNHTSVKYRIHDKNQVGIPSMKNHGIKAFLENQRKRFDAIDKILKNSEYAKNARSQEVSRDFIKISQPGNFISRIKNVKLIQRQKIQDSLLIRTFYVLGLTK